MKSNPVVVRCAGLKAVLASALAVFLTIDPGPAFSASRDLQNSVVKIYVTVQRWSYAMPWQAEPAGNISGSGFVIRGKRIMTNAHVVSDARFLQVRKQSASRMFAARVEFIAHDCDIATLTVDDPSFFDDAPPVKLADRLPQIDDEVVALGYPVGGLRLSLTRGVVSRVDYSTYTHSGVDSHLVLQVDAAINPGNSGGPVLFRDRVVGLAFQGLQQAENIGYAIPLPVVNRFLDDIKDGVYNGFPELGVVHMDLRNKALRASLRLPEAVRGVAVNFVDPFAAAAGLLMNRDVLLSIDGHAIAEDGTVSMEGNDVVFHELLERKQCGDKVAFRVWRDGHEIEVTVPLSQPADPFAFRNLYDQRPEYLISGGLVFVPLTKELLRTFPEGQPSPAIQQLYYYAQYAKLDGLHKEFDQFVVLSRRLPHPLNSYLDPYINDIVVEADGVPVRNLAALKKALEGGRDGFHVLRFACMKDPMVLDAAAVREADPEILRAYGVPAPFYLEKKP